MKKALAITLLLTVLLLSACGRNNTEPVPSTGAAPQVTEATDTRPTEQTMMPEKTTEAANNSSSQPVTEPSETTGPTVPSETVKPTAPTEPKEEIKKDPLPAATQPTEETQPSTTEPGTQPTETEASTETTNPPTQPTEPEEEKETTTPPAIEEAVCKHEWKCIHHDEEGHWRAGIICDCGWTVCGDPDTLTALWNAHSASFPAAESLFDHGGFGSMDEWIVDKPAYDEWVCCHCGEPKP